MSTVTLQPALLCGGGITPVFVLALVLGVCIDGCLCSEYLQYRVSIRSLENM